MCDSIIIEKIVLNLLSNAIKYSKRGITIYVFISVKKCVVKISVKDEGCGIGLSIVKSMIDILDGKINVKSELNK